MKFGWHPAKLLKDRSHGLILSVDLDGKGVWAGQHGLKVLNCLSGLGLLGPLGKG